MMDNPNQITAGEALVLRAEFSLDGAYKNPITPVQVWVEAPDGTVSGPFEATQQSTGIFTHQFTTSQAGVHEYRFQSADNAIEEGEFFVRPPRVPI